MNSKAALRAATALLFGLLVVVLLMFATSHLRTTWVTRGTISNISSSRLPYLPTCAMEIHENREIQVNGKPWLQLSGACVRSNGQETCDFQPANPVDLKDGSDPLGDFQEMSMILNVDEDTSWEVSHRAYEKDPTTILLVNTFWTTWSILRYQPIRYGMQLPMAWPVGFLPLPCTSAPLVPVDFWN